MQRVDLNITKFCFARNSLGICFLNYIPPSLSCLKCVGNFIHYNQLIIFIYNII